VFNVDPQGLEQAGKLLRALEKIAELRMVADLNAKDRHDNATLNNAEILQFLADQKRDFVTPSKDALKKIDKAALEYIEGQLARYKVGRSGSNITNKGEMTKGKAAGVLGEALRRNYQANQRGGLRGGR
jgi:histidyl-tRNA synthetase